MVAVLALTGLAAGEPNVRGGAQAEGHAGGWPGSRVLSENHPPSVKIETPAGSAVLSAGAPVNYRISVADKEDGSSGFDEINAKEVLLEVRYMGAAASGKPATGAPASSVSALSKSVPDDAPGLAVIITSNCFNCHNFNGKAIGPSFYDISKRYPAAKASTDTLVRRIKDGSSGVWGKEKMPSHPELDAGDIKRSVQWILANAAKPNITYYNGTTGILSLNKKGSYLFTASYTDHGVKGSAHPRAKGFDRIVVSVR